MTKLWLVLLLIPDLAAAAAREQPAARTDRVVTVSRVGGTESGASVHLRVALTNSSARPVRVVWACACDRITATSHDHFRFIVRRGRLRREVEACDHSAEKRSCRRCLPVHATLAPKSSKSFEWQLALRKLLGRAGEARVQVPPPSQPSTEAERRTSKTTANASRAVTLYCVAPVTALNT